MRLAIIGVGVAAIILLSGGYLAFNKTQILNENRCWGCLSLNPKGKLYDGFWIDYPEEYGKKNISHPDWLIETLDKVNAVMLFFWYEGCSACTVLWNKMKEQGLVKGDEADGELVGFENVTLFTIDTINDEWKDALFIYSQRGGSPTTVVLFKEDDTVYWYAFEGSNLPKDINGREIEVREILEDAVAR